MAHYTPPPVEIRSLINSHQDVSAPLVRVAMRFFAMEVPEYADQPKNDVIDTLLRVMYDHIDYSGSGSVKILSAHKRNPETATPAKEMVGAVEMLTFGNEAMLSNFAVREDKRGQGIGSFLLDNIELTARYNKISSLNVMCNNGNRDFYEKRGFLIEKISDVALLGTKILAPFPAAS